MNETERRLAWHKASSALHLGGKDQDWPDRLELPVIARLHDLAAPEAMLGFLNAEADAGRLPIESGDYEEALPGRRVTPSRYLEGGPSYYTTPPRVVKRTFRAARAADVAQVLAGVETGRLLAAWLAPYAVPSEEGKDVPPAATKTAMKLEYVIDALAVTYPELRNAAKRNDPMLKHFRTGKWGHYYLEDVEAWCAVTWPGRVRTPALSTLVSIPTPRVIRGGKSR